MLGSTSIFFSAYATSDFFGKLIFIGLFALSIITWFVLVQKVLLYKNVRKESNKLQALILQNKENVLGISEEVLDVDAQNETANPFMKIYVSLKEKTIEVLDKNHFFYQKKQFDQGDEVFLSRGDVDLMEAHVASVITSVGKGLEKNLFILSTVVSLAPFLGILGTVWGILISLGELQTGSMAHSNTVVLGGLSTALATTVLGLVIAIPALIGNNYLKSFLHSFYAEMHDFSNLLLSTIELQYRRVEVT